MLVVTTTNDPGGTKLWQHDDALRTAQVSGVNKCTTAVSNAKKTQ